MMTPKQGHNHKFTKLVEEKVLLARYHNEDGEAKYKATTGYDIVKLWQCSVGKCEAKVAFDLERTKV